MKSKRRHELQQNVLDAELGKVVGFFKRYGSHIAWGVLILSAAALVWAFWSRKVRTDEAAEMALRTDVKQAIPLLAADNQDDAVFEKLGLLRDSSNDRVAAEATLDTARANAFRMLRPDRATFRDEDIAEAKTYYELTLKEGGDYPVLVAYARLGLGKLALEVGDLATARKEFEAVLATQAIAGHVVETLAENERNKLKELTPADVNVPLAKALPEWAKPKEPEKTPPASETSETPEATETPEPSEEPKTSETPEETPPNPKTPEPAAP